MSSSKRSKDTSPAPADIADLLAVMARLRDPVVGCPWDLQQSFETIAPYTIEEAYEVADAIMRGDREDLKDELGDLLLQVVFHAQMASEQGLFEFRDVVAAICAKMIRRHPHVFEESARPADADGVRETWEQIKSEEKARKRSADGTPRGRLDDVPANLPGLVRAVKLTRRAGRAGFDWPHAEDVLDKLAEEIGELDAEIKAEPMNKDNAEAELGDVLFVLANLARKLDIDPERAIRRSNQKFIDRFEKIEAFLAARGKTPETSTLEEMDDLWNAAKQALRNQDTDQD